MEPNAAPNWGLWISAIGQFVTWCLVIAGWLVINRQHNRREARKETRAQLDELRIALVELEQSAENYHLAASHSEEHARKIKVQLQRAIYVIDRLGILNRLVRDVRVIALRRAITFRNFDSKDHVAQELSGELVARINATVDELINALELAYRTRNPVD